MIRPTFLITETASADPKVGGGIDMKVLSLNDGVCDIKEPEIEDIINNNARYFSAFASNFKAIA